ncbi:MAG: class I SAM-dependent methyltransferase [Candidatus Bathyarchaeia archaeon]|jgi:SAM-dependent methyltransferase
MEKINENRKNLSTKDIIQRFPVRESELDRFKFGKKWYRETTSSSHKNCILCLDVGSGHKPFPMANLLCDPFPRPHPDRKMRELETENKPFVQCDGRHLPFRSQIFDFVTSYYTIEHVDNPEDLVSELKRVAKHGYLQCPSQFNEFLYGEDVHKWIIIKKNNHLYAIRNKTNSIKLGFFFNRLYSLNYWKIIHAMIDETFNIFSIKYTF